MPLPRLLRLQRTPGAPAAAANDNPFLPKRPSLWPRLGPALGRLVLAPRWPSLAKLPRPSPWWVATAPLGLLAATTVQPDLATELLPLAQAAVLSLAQHLGQATTLPTWSVYLLGASAAALAWRLAARRPAGPQAPAEPRREDYVRDRFLGVLWEWRYNARQVPVDLWASCPDCATRLVSYTTRPPEEKRLKMYCEHCRVNLLSEAGERDYLHARVARQIERKLRTGEWQEAVRQPLVGGAATAAKAPLRALSSQAA